MLCVGNRNNTQTLQELKTNIIIENNEIHRGQLIRVARNMLKHVDKCIGMDGQHLNIICNSVQCECLSIKYIGYTLN